MKEKFLRFMQGRYGVDQFSKGSAHCGTGSSALVLIFCRRKGRIIILFTWMDIDHLLLFPYILQKCI